MKILQRNGDEDVSPKTWIQSEAHERCHRKEMNHSDRFWNEVARIIPDYKSRKQWLKDHGASLIARI